MRVPSLALAWILDIQIVKKQHNQRLVVDEHRICVEVQTSHLRCKKHLVEHLSAMSNLSPDHLLNSIESHVVSETAFVDDSIYNGKQNPRIEVPNAKGVKEGHTRRKKKMQRSNHWFVAIRGKKMESCDDSMSPLETDGIFLHGEAQGAIHACLSRAARLGAKLTTAKLSLALLCSGGRTSVFVLRES
ncbi:hypothetical protein GW17_00050173 [Ensete ventricosum]|nr:hypothetical protein GW17_00050173 [Ensete ventricosum]